MDTEENIPDLFFEKDDYSDILTKDARYDSRAYDFIMDVLNRGISDIHMGLLGGNEAESEEPAEDSDESSNTGGEEHAHLDGHQLLESFRYLALEAFGPMAYTVLNDWGIHSCEDVGEVVFNLCDSKRMGTNAGDSREDFVGGYDFKEAFLDPYAVDD